MNIKIFIGLIEISGYYKNLKKGLLENGIDTVFIDLSNHLFKYSGDDEPLFFIKIYKKVIKYKSNYIVKPILYLFSIIIKIPIFIWALLNYKIFIFGFGQSFFNLMDLPILKLFNKKILFVFNGSDERPPYIDGSYLDINIHLLKKMTKKIYKRTKFIEKYADLIITHPAYAHFHQKKFIKALYLGIPYDFNVNNNHEKIKNTKNIRILHAPSNPIAKGTSIFRKTIDYLKRKGYNIEYIEVSGRPHHEVIELLQSCDFVLDQIYSDTPMASFATEAAYFGKPAIVGGYYKNFIDNDYPLNVIPPSLYCHPDEVANAIEKLINDTHYREELGRKAKEFVHRQWAPKEVAKRYIKLIFNNFPHEWVGKPNEITYTHGWGLSEQYCKKNIRKMIDTYGLQSLYLYDKPELERIFIEFAYASNNTNYKKYSD